MKPSPIETDLVGHGVVIDRQMKADDTWKRIDWLVENHLEKIGSSKESGGWSTLFRDPDDGRFWERTFPDSAMQGGGPPRLTALSEEDANANYKNLVTPRW